MKKKTSSIKLFLKILGIILIISGIGCMIFGFVDFSMSSSLDNFEGPKHFYMFFIGMFLLFFGMIFISYGFKDEVLKYRSKEISAVINGINETNNNSFINISSKESVICPNCKTANSLDSKFCKSCGSSLVKTCPYCNHELKNDSIYCDNCGMKVNTSNKD